VQNGLGPQQNGPNFSFLSCVYVCFSIHPPQSFHHPFSPLLLHISILLFNFSPQSRSLCLNDVNQHLITPFDQIHFLTSSPASLSTNDAIHTTKSSYTNATCLKSRTLGGCNLLGRRRGTSRARKRVFGVSNHTRKHFCFKITNKLSSQVCTIGGSK
jgi:hypothetical protein